MQRGSGLTSTVIVEHRVDPPDIKIRVINSVLDLVGLEAMQVHYLLVLLNNTFCKYLLHTMNITLGTNNIEDQGGLLRFCRLAGSR